MFEGTRERPYVSSALQLSRRRLPLSTLRFSAHYDTVNLLTPLRFLHFFAEKLRSSSESRSRRQC